MCFRDFCVAFIVPHDVGDAKYHTNRDAEESETADACRPAPSLLKDNGECREHHVHGAVYNGHVQAQEEHNGLPEQEFPRPRQGRPELFAHRARGLSDIELAKVDLAGDFGELGCAQTQQSWRVCFGHSEDNAQPHNAGKDGHQPLEPTPSGGIA